MPLHRNESSSQKTLNFKGEETFIKENHMLSRERVTVFTQVSSDSKFYKSKFVFKGKGTRTKINVEEDIKFQWFPSGSYRLDQLLKTKSNLPNRYHPFTQRTMSYMSSTIMQYISCQKLEKRYFNADTFLLSWVVELPDSFNRMIPTRIVN